MMKQLTADEVGIILGYRPSTIQRWARTGVLLGIKFGREWRFAEADIQAYVEAASRAHGQSSAEHRLKMLDVDAAYRAAKAKSKGAS